ncbi:MAG: DUF2513 domain-containing protein [Leptolyngbya sp. UWPOB_LEPTO1]|uniref:DUF2513 domain-containing protein n=1 Tax=Leptolyngbya sp. UWPOB_LEPTO1 TaxID=2815653 RepID=UPI001AC6B6D5|nr:DUF2513 domain-containing protein [Leptolyngbya sp. UWPOB_LEPTO1]MBN8563971.1 DUF2513 domain-containing protein [Leptolyngbya sp. UWPOB_LEPTO1]
MQRDMNLVRNILLKLEKQDTGYINGVVEGLIEEYPRSLIIYHIHIMMQGQLVEVVPQTNQASIIPVGFSEVWITWQGHEFLDAARDETRWNKAMATVQQNSGSVTVGVLIQVLSGLMKNSLGVF